MSRKGYRSYEYFKAVSQKFLGRAEYNHENKYHNLYRKRHSKTGSPELEVTPVFGFYQNREGKMGPGETS